MDDKARVTLKEGFTVNQNINSEFDLQFHNRKTKQDNLPSPNIQNDLPGNRFFKSNTIGSEQKYLDDNEDVEESISLVEKSSNEFVNFIDQSINQLKESEIVLSSYVPKQTNPLFIKKSEIINSVTIPSTKFNQNFKTQ